jgi:acid stress-induced BolA-like protein IbaG/YrbA
MTKQDINKTIADVVKNHKVKKAKGNNRDFKLVVFGDENGNCEFLKMFDDAIKRIVKNEK